MVRARLVLGRGHGMSKSGVDEITGGPDLSVPSPLENQVKAQDAPRRAPGAHFENKVRGLAGHCELIQAVPSTGEE